MDPSRLENTASIAGELRKLEPEQQSAYNTGSKTGKLREPEPEQQSAYNTGSMAGKLRELELEPEQQLEQYCFGPGLAGGSL